MARKEREKHMVMYPGWSARDNYGKRKKNKVRSTHQVQLFNCNIQDQQGNTHMEGKLLATFPLGLVLTLPPPYYPLLSASLKYLLFIVKLTPP